jgi:hypothetical protein
MGPSKEMAINNDQSTIDNQQFPAATEGERPLEPGAWGIGYIDDFGLLIWEALAVWVLQRKWQSPMNNQQSAINNQQSAISNQQSAIRHWGW